MQWCSDVHIVSKGGRVVGWQGGWEAAGWQGGWEAGWLGGRAVTGRLRGGRWLGDKLCSSVPGAFTDRVWDICNTIGTGRQHFKMHKFANGFGD